jgi:glutathione S-transferase
MRRLLHLPLSPASRFVRLVIGEKRMTCDLATADETENHLPVLIELDGSRSVGLWAIIDHLEGAYPEPLLMPEDAASRAEALRWLDWSMGQLLEQVTAKIVFEKAPQRFTGASSRRAPDMNVIRQGREALKGALQRIGRAAEEFGNLAARTCSLGDLAVAAHVSTLDYFGEVPWSEFPTAAEWYMRMKSRPSFRSVLADRVPGQPPVAHYGELDF